MHIDKCPDKLMDKYSYINWQIGRKKKYTDKLIDEY